MDVDLREAIVEGDLNKVRNLAGHGVNIRSQNDEPLIVAVQLNRIEIVNYLLINGADVNSRNGEPLSIAARENYLDIVKLLLIRGANVNIDQDKALLNAVDNNNIFIAKILLDNGANINTQNNLAFTLASAHEYTNMLEFLEDYTPVYPIISIAPTITVLQNQTGACDINQIKYENGHNIPIDPIDFKPIPKNLLVTVVPINYDPYKSKSQCFNAKNLWNWWINLIKGNQPISANNPVTKEEFDERAIVYVKKLVDSNNRIEAAYSYDDMFKLKYPETYNDKNLIGKIFTNPNYNPNFIINDIPLWVWILYNSPDSNLIHYTLNDPRLSSDNVNVQNLLEIASTKEASVRDRIYKSFKKN